MGWLIWLGVALVLAAAEVATLAFVCIMLAGGALIGGLAAAVGLPVPVQVVAFAIVSALLLVLVRKAALAKFLPAKQSGVGVAGTIGRMGVVVETVTEYDGRIKLPGDAVWSARLASTTEPPSAPGETVQVVRIEGATAIVARPQQVQPVQPPQQESPQ
jgi:membrane protein implicated in regulation of membrane protease activity